MKLRTDNFTGNSCKTVVLLAGLLLLDHYSPLFGRFRALGPLAALTVELQNSELNADDYHALAAGYYEGIEDTNRISRGAENDDYRLRDDFLRYEFKPNLRRRYAEGMRITNSLGMANPEYGIRKPPNTWRIAWLGDSVSTGPYGQSFETLLENRLNRDAGPSGRRYQILNFSAPGYILLQKMDIALEKAPKFQPDVYVVMLDSQEVGGSQRHLSRLVAKDRDFKYEFLRRMAAEAGVKPTDHRPVVVDKLMPFFKPMARWALGQIKENADSHGSRILVVLIPVPIDPAVTASDFDQLHTAVDGLGVPVIDLRNTFRSVDWRSLQVSPGADIHPNVRGHQMIFEDLYGALQAQPDAFAALTGIDPRNGRSRQ
jgi:hypothetical protein